MAAAAWHDQHGKNGVNCSYKGDGETEDGETGRRGTFEGPPVLEHRGDKGLHVEVRERVVLLAVEVHVEPVCLLQCEAHLHRGCCR